MSQFSNERELKGTLVRFQVQSVVGSHRYCTSLILGNIFFSPHKNMLCITEQISLLRHYKLPAQQDMRKL